MNVEIINNEVLQSKTYILWDENHKDTYIVDCGDIGPILQFLRQHDKNLAGVLLTHGHYDHIYGLKDLISIYPNMKLMGTIHALEALGDSDKNMSYMYDIEEEYEISTNLVNKLVLSNDSNISLLGECLECIYTPGHDIDCMTYIIENKIFTGDSYNPDFDVFAKWKRSSFLEARNNETFLRELVDKRRLIVFPGHYK